MTRLQCNDLHHNHFENPTIGFDYIRRRAFLTISRYKRAYLDARSSTIVSNDNVSARRNEYLLENLALHQLKQLKPAVT